MVVQLMRSRSEFNSGHSSIKSASFIVSNLRENSHKSARFLLASSSASIVEKFCANESLPYGVGSSPCVSIATRLIMHGTHSPQWVTPSGSQVFRQQLLVTGTPSRIAVQTRSTTSAFVSDK